MPYPAVLADSEEIGEVESPLEHVEECECCRLCCPRRPFLATCCGAAPRVASLAAADPSYTAAWTARCCARGSVHEESVETAREEDINRNPPINTFF